MPNRADDSKRGVNPYPVAYRLGQMAREKGQLFPLEAADYILTQYGEDSGLLYRRRDGEWGLSLALRTALRQVTGYRIVWDPQRNCWVRRDEPRGG